MTELYHKPGQWGVFLVGGVLLYSALVLVYFASIAPTDVKPISIWVRALM